MSNTPDSINPGLADSQNAVSNTANTAEQTPALTETADTVRLEGDTLPHTVSPKPEAFLVAPPVAPAPKPLPPTNASESVSDPEQRDGREQEHHQSDQSDQSDHSDATVSDESTPLQSTPNGRMKTLIVGVAVGALIGGLVGGGTASVIAANNSQNNSSFVAPGSSITVNNPNSVSAVTAVASAATPSVVTLQVTSSGAAGSGSGVIYSEDGYIITNSHVATLSGATANPDIRVRLSDGTMLDGELIGTDPFADIAVVKVDAQGLPAIKIADSNEINVGEEAIAIGAPLSLSNTVTSGIVSALNRGISVQNSMVPEGAEIESPEPSTEDGGQSPFPWDFRFETPQQRESEQVAPAPVSSRVAISVLQTDAPINPGNSGGALLNNQGELIGINVALAANGASADTAGSVGLGFAIPSNLATRVSDALIAGQQPSHGKLGVSVLESSRDTDEDALREGALIAEMPEDSAAARAGLKVGDVITAINGFNVESSTSASALIRFHEGEEVVTVTYSRGGALDTVDVKLDTLQW